MRSFLLGMGAACVLETGHIASNVRAQGIKISEECMAFPESVFVVAPCSCTASSGGVVGGVRASGVGLGRRAGTIARSTAGLGASTLLAAGLSQLLTAQLRPMRCPGLSRAASEHDI